MVLFTDQVQKYVYDRVIMQKRIKDDSSKLMCTPEHKAGRAALWLSCVACFVLSASVYADNGASQPVLSK